MTATGATEGTEFDVFYVTTSNDTIADIASNFADRINAAPITGVHAGVAAAGTAVTLQAEPIRVSSWRRSLTGIASTLRTLRPGCHPVDDGPLSRMFPWRDALVNVKGIRTSDGSAKDFDWRSKSKPRGRPRFAKALRQLLREIAAENSDVSIVRVDKKRFATTSASTGRQN